MNPAVGQVWDDGISAGIAWRVKSVDHDGTVVEQLRDNEPTGSTLLWAVGRPWSLFVDRQQATLRRPRKKAVTA